MRDALSGAVRALSVLPHELPDAIEKLQGDVRERQKLVASLQQDLAAIRRKNSCRRRSGRPPVFWLRAPSTPMRTR